MGELDTGRGLDSLLLVQNGSVEGALSGQPSIPARTAIRLDWKARVAVSLNAARALKDLQATPLKTAGELISPGKVLFNEDMVPKMQPPHPVQLASQLTVSDWKGILRHTISAIS